MSQFAGKTDVEPLNHAGEVVEALPRRGTLAWVQAQPTVLVLGRVLPACHRIPDGSVFRTDDERGSRCALVKPGGKPCGAPATKAYGICLPHLGGGGDIREMSAKGSAKLTRLKVQRQVLGIGPRSMGNPRALARLAAAERAAEVADALLAPLGDRKLASMDRQRAAVAILGETFPLATATVEVELPSEPGEVGAMGWQEMQALAARLLTTT